MEKRTRNDNNAVNDGFENAIYSFSETLNEVCSATTVAANTPQEELSAQAEREFQLKENAVELDAVKDLFNDSDKASKLYPSRFQTKAALKSVGKRKGIFKRVTAPLLYQTS